MNQRAQKNRHELTGSRSCSPRFYVASLDREEGRYEATGGDRAVRIALTLAIEPRLPVQEFLPVGSERPLEPQRHLWRQGCLPVQHVRERGAAYSQTPGRLCDRHTFRDDALSECRYRCSARGSHGSP